MYIGFFLEYIYTYIYNFPIHSTSSNVNTAQILQHFSNFNNICFYYHFKLLFDINNQTSKQFEVFIDKASTKVHNGDKMA